MEKEGWEMYQCLLTGVILLGCSVTDLKGRKIYKAAAAGYLMFALLGHMMGGTFFSIDLAFSLLPGLVCFVLSWVSRQSLGYGDSALILGCGLSLGLWPCVEMLLFAFFLAGVWAIGLLLFRRARRGKEIPFTPFLFLGLVIGWAGGVLQ